MKILHLEIHKYAPEMNTLVLKNGISFRVPGCITIRGARQKLFPKPFKGLGCRMYSEYEDPRFQWLNRHLTSGRVPTRLWALRESRFFQQTGGVLQDKTHLPPNKVRIKFIYN